MEVRISTPAPEHLRAELLGELDHHASGKVIGTVRSFLDRRPVHTLELDFGGVSFSDSSGIAVAMLFYRMQRSMGGELRLARVPAQTERLFRTAGIHRILNGGKEDGKAK